MSLLTVVQDACRRIGIVPPSGVMSSNDPQITQLLTLLNQEGQSLADRYDWQVLRKEATFSALASEDQGSFASIAGDTDLKNFVVDAFWNRSLRRPVLGPVSPQDWQTLKASPNTGPLHQFILRSNHVLMIPQPSAGDIMAFEYTSSNWVTSADGTTGKPAYAADDDIGLLSESIMTVGLVWRWKHTKGLEYAEDFRLYEQRVIDAMGRDKAPTAISMMNRPNSRLPGTVVPSGNWNVS